MKTLATERSDFFAWLDKVRQEMKEIDKYARESGLHDCMPDFTTRIVDNIDCDLTMFRKNRMSDEEIWQRHKKRKTRQHKVNTAWLLWIKQ